jgi:hypothetical protein
MILLAFLISFLFKYFDNRDVESGIDETKAQVIKLISCSSSGARLVLLALTTMASVVFVPHTHHPNSILVLDASIYDIRDNGVWINGCIGCL